MKRIIRAYYNYTLAVGSAAVVASAPAAWAQTPQTLTRSTTLPSGSSTDSKTTKFLKEAANGNDKEIAIAQVGIGKAQNAEVKALAQHMFQDHQKAKPQLTRLTQEYNVNVEPEKSDREMSKLQKLTGADFDKEFATYALKDHHEDIALYQKATEHVQAADVKAFAQQTLPILHQHLDHAVRAAQAVGVSQATISAYSKETRGAMGGSSTVGEENTQQTGQGTSQNSK